MAKVEGMTQLEAKTLERVHKILVAEYGVKGERIFEAIQRRFLAGAF